MPITIKKMAVTEQPSKPAGPVISMTHKAMNPLNKAASAKKPASNGVKHTKQVQVPAQAKAKPKTVIPTQTVTPPKQEDVFQQDLVASTVVVQKVDRLIALDAVLSPLKPVLKEFGEAKKFLQSIADADGDPKQSVEVHGTDGNRAIFGPKCDQQEITDRKGLLAALKQRIGYDALVDLIDIPLGALKDYLSEAELAQFVTKKEATGPRNLKAVVKGIKGA